MYLVVVTSVWYRPPYWPKSVTMSSAWTSIKNKVKLLQQGHVSIFEPGLAAMVKENLESGRLHFTYR